MTRRWASLTVVATLVLTSMTASGVAATTGTDRQQAHSETVDPPAVVVALHEDGSVTVTVTFTYDLSDEDRKQAFEDLQNTESTRADFRDRFQQRMASVAADAANETGRESPSATPPSRSGPRVPPVSSRRLSPGPGWLLSRATS